jgi:hypothetical protein
MAKVSLFLEDGRLIRRAIDLASVKRASTVNYIKSVNLFYVLKLNLCQYLNNYKEKIFFRHKITANFRPP